MNEPARPANWYPDPTGRHQHRYWDGTAWTDQVADNQVTGTDPPTMPPAATPPVAPTVAAPPAPAPGAPPPAPIGRPPGGVPVTPRLNQPSPRHNASPVFAVIAAVGGVALGIGSFLEAASASTGSGALGVSVTQDYMDGDGPITLVVGIAVVALAVLLVAKVLPRWAGWIIVLLGAIGALVAVADIVDVQDSIDQIEALGASASIGPALWVCLIGGIVALVGGGLAALIGGSDSS